MALAGLSFVISILALVQPLYMMNLFDRVLASLSIHTLVALTGITLVLIAALSVLETHRQRALVRIGQRVDQVLGRPTFDSLMRASLGVRAGMSNMIYVDTVRNFVSSTAVTTMFDLPFAPIFVLVLWLIHPYLGLATLLCCAIIIVIGLWLQGARRNKLVDGLRDGRRATAFADIALRNAEVAVAMGMQGNLRSVWQKIHGDSVHKTTEVSDQLSRLSGAMRGTMITFSVLLLALACYLTIEGSVTAGAMFATNILAMRILGPVQHALSAWDSYVKAREALENLVELMRLETPRLPAGDALILPAPLGKLTVRKLVAGPPAGDRPIVTSANFTLQPGSTLAIIGASGSGKSSLTKCILGLWTPKAGAVQLDDADLTQYDPETLGRHLGYVAQEVEFFEGTVAQNIARFGSLDDEAVIQSAKSAGIHELILSLENGYNTVIRPRKGILSTGQRQRLAIARAVYGNPQLVVMDEPNSNLDADGEKALGVLLDQLKQRGATTVIVAHDRRLLAHVDLVLVMQKGRQIKFGERDAVLEQLGLST